MKNVMNMEIIKEKLTAFIGNMKPLLKKAKVYSDKMLDLICRHKIISVIIAVVMLFVCTVVGVLNHYLNKINYDDGTSQTAIHTQVRTTQVTLGTGETITINIAQMNSDGTFTLTDGRILHMDGSVRNTDGSIVFHDGSYITSNGIAVLSDGTTLYKDGTVVFQNGSYISATGVTVDSKGNVTFGDGSKLHISQFLIDVTGQILIKNTDVTSTLINIQNFQPSEQQTTQQPTQEYTEPTTERWPQQQNVVTDYYYEDEEDDSIIEDAKENEEIKEELEENDLLIEQNAHNNEIWYSDDIINILIMGIDSGNRTYPYGRSDAMIIASINKNTKKIKLVSVSRTAYVAIDGYSNTRLNHAHGYGGAQLAIRTIEDNYKIRIDNYVSTTFSAFQKMIDAIGGVDITFTAAEAEALKDKIISSGYEYRGKGTYNLNGALALEYVRLRKIDSDRERTQRQRNVLEAIATKARNMNVFELNNMLNNVLPYITTDLTKTEIVAQLINVPSYLSGSFDQYVLPHKSSALTLIDGYEVVLVDWEDEVKYVHDLFYSEVTPSYYTR